MELGISVSSNFEVYVGLCKEADFVRTKLGNKNISQGKREKLIYRLNDLEKRIIPRQVLLINVSDGSRLGHEKACW